METKEQKRHEKENNKDIKYHCPMKCEGDKLYDDPGDCPVCNMSLLPVDTKKKEGKCRHCC